MLYIFSKHCHAFKRDWFYLIKNLSEYGPITVNCNKQFNVKRRLINCNMIYAIAVICYKYFGSTSGDKCGWIYAKKEMQYLNAIKKCSTFEF